MSDLLAIDALRAGYGEAVVLPSMSLTLGEGQVLALLGRNGTGKTTLINSIVGITRRFGGTLALGGLDITAMRPDQRARAGIGWVPQERNIFRSLTVEENMTAVAQPGPWTVDKVYEMFPRLKERRSNFGNQLSGGEQQMLAIGRALTLNPKVLLLDEPTEGLAPIIVEELLRALGTITRSGGICSIIVEQNAQKILGLADRVVILERGAIVHDAASQRAEGRSRGARTLSRRRRRRRALDLMGVETMQRTKAPFRADEVGSLLRPQRIKEARAKLEKGEITAEDLRKAEDLEIEKVVHKQASIGLKLATDGEFRRSWWHFDFLAKLGGCELFHPETGIQFAGVETRHDAVRVIGKLDFPDNHPMLDHFRFLKKHADTAHVTAKMTIPSPAVLHFRGGRKSISKEVYPDLEEFYARSRQDLSQGGEGVLRRRLPLPAVRRYRVGLSLLAGGVAEGARARRQPRWPAGNLRARHQLRAGRASGGHGGHHPHVCRGNFRSTWISSGGYEPVAETMLAGTNYDGYFLEYDSDRAGGFEPLRYLPKGNKVVVVGVITSKFGELEKKDDIKRRLEEAAKFAPLDQLAVSPQCGFASTEEGNILSEEEQWAKLSLAVEVANEVWGK